MTDKLFTKRLRDLTDEAIRESLAEINAEFEKRFGPAALTASPPVVEREAEIAKAIAMGHALDAEDGGYPTPVAQGDEVRDALRAAISNVPLDEPEQIGNTGGYGAAVLTTEQTDDVLAAVLKALSPLMERLAGAEMEPLSDDRPLTDEDAVFISIGDLRAVRATLTKGARDVGTKS